MEIRGSSKDAELFALENVEDNVLNEVFVNTSSACQTWIFTSATVRDKREKIEDYTLLSENLTGVCLDNKQVLLVLKEHRKALLGKIASIRDVVQGAPLRAVLRQLASRTAEKVTVVFPMRFKDSIDSILSTSFLQRSPRLARAFVDERTSN
ncbi:Arp2/3 complex 34 kDa subunit [Forsythia ovata]|uniref:Arp2/3 complex 34 kDa subunit n=1 Tax=Forsythia ovata TaxID=205694 RepID=A0ABD1X9D0_9LAMI